MLYIHMRYLTDIALVTALTVAVYKIGQYKDKKESQKGGRENGITFKN